MSGKVDIAVAVKLWAEGLPSTKIAERCGCSKSTIVVLARHNPDQFPTRARGRLRSYSPEQLDAAAKLWAAGVAERAIPKRVGLAETFDLRSMRERNPDRFPVRVASPTGSTRRSVGASQVAAGPAAPAGAPADETEAAGKDIRPPRAEAFRPLAGFAPVPLVPCRGCMWPVHEGGDPLRTVARMFCGAPKRGGPMPYCDAHWRLAVRIVPDRVMVDGARPMEVRS